MTCSIDTDYIQKYIDGTLSPLEEIIIQEHIRNCPDCKKELTEIKLLLWELNELRDLDIEVPIEAAAIRENVLNTLNSISHEKIGIKDIIRLQKQTYKTSRRYLEFIPGLPYGTEIIQKGLKKAPSLIYMAAKKALLKGKRPSIARARA